MYDNSFSFISDVEKAQKIAESFDSQKLSREPKLRLLFLGYGYFRLVCMTVPLLFIDVHTDGLK